MFDCKPFKWCFLVLVYLLVFGSGQAQDDLSPERKSSDKSQQPRGGTQDLQKVIQNPVSTLISVPVQNNSNFGVGPFDRTQNILKIQPVIPVSTPLSTEFFCVFCCAFAEGAGCITFSCGIRLG